MLPQISPNNQITSSNITPPSPIAASARVPTTTIPIATGTTKPTPSPAPPTGAIAPKRPAASDLQRIAGASTTASKRQATSSGNRVARSIPNTTGASNASRLESPAFLQPQPLSRPPIMPAPTPITEDQLYGQTSEQLIATILHLQTQHQQFVAQITSQYENINQQLSELRGSLIISHQAAVTALTSRDQPARSIIPPPPAPHPQTAIPPPPRPPTQTATRTTSRAPPASPSHATVSRSSAPTLIPITGAPPQYDYRTVATVDEVWKEYRQGMDGQPAVEQLDATWGSRWRPEPRGRTWYSRRKVIWDKIKEFMSDGMDEGVAVQEVEKLRDGGTINKLIRMLQDERKDKGIGEDGIHG